MRPTRLCGMPCGCGWCPLTYGLDNIVVGESSSPALCRFRNGNGINPTEYSCVTEPALGTNWTTSYSHAANTIATLMVIGLGGPSGGFPFAGGEVLISLIPGPVFLTGAGDITILLPGDPMFLGAAISTQGVRLDLGAMGPEVVLLNALDILLGTPSR